MIAPRTGTDAVQVLGVGEAVAVGAEVGVASDRPGCTASAGGYEMAPTTTQPLLGAMKLWMTPSTPRPEVE